MAFKRIVEMEVGTTDNSVLISDLDVEFNISRSRKFSDNTASFKVYNPTDDTISKILKPGNSVIFKAGYDDEGIGLLFVGQIMQSVPKREPPNKIVSLECNSVQNADTSLEAVTVSLGYKKGVAITQPLEEIASALGLSTAGMDNADGINLENGYTLAGTAKEAMRYLNGVLERHGCGLFIDNATLTVSKDGEGNNLRAVVLSPETGLMEAPTLTSNTEGNEAVQAELTKRVIFKSILNYKIVPNGYIKIETNTTNGEFIVDKCSFSGNNFGGSFEVTGEGIGS